MALQQSFFQGYNDKQGERHKAYGKYSCYQHRESAVVAGTFRLAVYESQERVEKEHQA